MNMTSYKYCNTRIDRPSLGRTTRYQKEPPLGDSGDSSCAYVAEEVAASSGTCRGAERKLKVAATSGTCRGADRNTTATAKDAVGLSEHCLL